MTVALKAAWPVRHADDVRALSALVGLGVIGALGTWSFLPLVVNQAVVAFGLDERSAGFLAAAEMAGSGAATFLASFIVHRRERRMIVCCGLLLIALGSAVSLWAGHFGILLAGRSMTGIGEGAVIAAVIASMAGTRWPERNFGIWTIVNMAAASLLFFIVMPNLIGQWGLSGVFTAYLGLTIPGFLLLAWYPVPQTERRNATKSMGVLSPAVLACLAAILAAHLAHGGIWAYIERIGISSGASPQLVGRALGSAAFAGLLGGILVTLLGTRRGRVLPNAVALALSAASLLFLILGHTAALFVSTAMVFYFAWVFGLPYLMGIVAYLDPAGQAATLAIVAQSVGLAGGPWIAGNLVTATRYGNLLWLGLGLYLAALSIAVPLAHLADRRESERMGQQSG
jgi:predicted MFS family arabinose efflux permease